MKKKLIICILAALLCVTMTACQCEEMVQKNNSQSEDVQMSSQSNETAEGTESTEENSVNGEELLHSEEASTLLYLGQASMRITTTEGKVIYIDPYAGTTEDYEPNADLILVTHNHFDHTAVDKVENRNEDCRVITQEEAIQDGEHITFDLGYVTVQPVEAGYNRMHDVRNCVGYVLTFSNGKSVYVTGDTSKTEQMSEMSAMNIDYAFYCTDGAYNMGNEEAAECAELVGAKHNIPYHNDTSNSGDMFDEERAEEFNAPNKMIVLPGEELKIE